MQRIAIWQEKQGEDRVPAKKFLKTLNVDKYVLWTENECRESTFKEILQYETCNFPTRGNFSVLLKWLATNAGNSEIYILTNGELWSPDVVPALGTSWQIRDASIRVNMCIFNKFANWRSYLPFAGFEGNCWLNGRKIEQLRDLKMDNVYQLWTLSEWCIELTHDAVSWLRRVYLRILRDSKRVEDVGGIVSIKDAKQWWNRQVQMTDVEKSVLTMFENIFKFAGEQKLAINEGWPIVEWREKDKNEEFGWPSISLYGLTMDKREMLQVSRNPLLLLKKRVMPVQLAADNECDGIIPLAKYDEYNDCLVAYNLFDGLDRGINYGVVYWVLAKKYKELIENMADIDFGYHRRILALLTQYARYRLGVGKCLLTLDDWPNVEVPTWFALWWNSMVTCNGNVACVYGEIEEMLTEYGKFELVDVKEQMKVTALWVQAKNAKMWAWGVANEMFEKEYIESLKGWVFVNKIRKRANWDMLKIKNFDSWFEIDANVNVLRKLKELVWVVLPPIGDDYVVLKKKIGRIPVLDDFCKFFYQGEFVDYRVKIFPTNGMMMVTDVYCDAISKDLNI